MRHTLEGIFSTLLAARPAWIAAALALYVVSLFVAGARWRWILRALGSDVRLRRSVLVYMAGIFVSNTTPASRLGGEASRIALIRRSGVVTIETATTSVALDRMSELPPVTILALVTLPAVYGLRVPAGVRAAVLVVVGLLLAGAAWQIRRSRRATPAPAPGVRRSRWPSGAEMLRVLPVATGYSAVVWGQDVARMFVVAAACGVFLTVPQAATLSMVALIGGLAPTIGGVGVIEAGLVGGLLAFGVPADRAGAIVAIERAISLVLGTAAGGVALTILGGRWLWNVSRSR